MVKVEVYVYDLSRGMAASMSQAILGQRIDGIWHTGIVVLDKEYYFGGGIQVSPKGMFARQSNMPAVKIHFIGESTKTIDELNAFLRSIHHKFTAQTYDLLRNNCNNFSNEVSIFLTGQSIPSYIIDLPRTVFSTPQGAMLRPMFESMQQSIQRESGYSMDPFGGSTANSSISASTSLGNSSGESSTQFESYISESIKASLQDNQTTVRIVTKVDLEEQPLTSSDKGAVSVIANKILTLKTADGTSALSEEDTSEINEILVLLSAANHGTFRHSNYQLLQRIMTSYPIVEMSCLFILRLMVLNLEPDIGSILSIHSFVIEKLTRGPRAFASVPATVMGLCLLANLLSSKEGIKIMFGINGDDYQTQSSLIDIAMAGLSHTRVEIRQMASALAYNYILVCTHGGLITGPWAATSSVDEIHQQAVEFLLGNFEGLAIETDGVVRKRRLSIICRIVRTYSSGDSCLRLAQDLGLLDSVRSLHAIISQAKVHQPSHEFEIAILTELANSLSA